MTSQHATAKHQWPIASKKKALA